MLGLGFALTNFGTKGGVVDTPDLSGSSAAALLAAYGGEGFSMIFDSTAPSIKITDSTTPSNDWDSDLGDGYSVQDFFKNRSFTSYTGPVISGKRLMQADGYIKPCRHNLLALSEVYPDPGVTIKWANQSDAVTRGQADPFGTTKASKFALGMGAVLHRIYQAAIVTTSTPVTCSYYAKANGYNYVYIREESSTGAGAVFDLSGSGSVVGTYDAGSVSISNATITAVSGYAGWFRVSCVMSFSSATTVGFGMGFPSQSWTSGDPANAWSGDTVSGAYFAFPMVNSGTQPLEYVSSEAHNLVIQSRTLGTSWTATDITVGNDATTSPDGTTSAESLTEGVAGTALLRSTAFTVPASSTVTAYFYLKTSTATWVRVTLADGSDTNGLRQWFILSTGAKGPLTALGSGTATSSNITACGNGWYLCEITGVCSTSTSLTMSLSSASADASNTRVNSVVYYADCAQATLSSSALKVTTTTTTAQYLPHFDIPVEFNADGTVKALRREEARTNLALYSNDLTNAAWTKSNMSTAKTATGADGASNSATTCTATAANATVLQAITSASSARITSAYIKRRAGSGNIDMTQDNGSTWTTVSVTSAWTRLNIASVTSTNPTVGLRIVTSGDAVDVMYFQHEAAATVSSPIVTGSAAVSRAVDVIECSNRVFGWTDATLTAYTKATLQSIAATQRLIAIDDGTANETHQLSIVASTGVYNSTTVDGGVTQANASTGNAVTAGTAFKAATSIKVNDLAAGLNNGTLVADTSITMPTVHTIRFGAGLSAAAPSTGEVHEFLIVPTDLSDAQLGSLTTL